MIRNGSRTLKMNLDSIALQLGSIFDASCGTEGDKNTDILKNCGLDDQFLQASLAPFELITGGMIGFIFWGVLIFSVYLKYENAMLAILTGMPVLFLSALAFPSGFDAYLTAMLASAICCALFILIWKIPRD